MEKTILENARQFWGFSDKRKGAGKLSKKVKMQNISEAGEEPWNKRMLGSAGDKGSTCNIFNIVTLQL